MSEHGHFEAFELTSADYSFPMFYAGATISFRLKFPESGVPILRMAVKQLTAHLPFLTGIVVPSVDHPGVMQVRPADCSKPESEKSAPLCTVQRLPHLCLPSRPASSSQNNVGAYDRNASLILAPVQVAASTSNHPVIRFQINVLADGIIFALFVNHMVIDGTGIGTLIESLAVFCQEVSGSVPALEIPSNSACEATTRAFLMTIGKRAGGAQTASAESEASIGHEEVHDASLIDYNFRFSAEKVQKVRHYTRKLGLEMISPDSSPVSEDDVVTAILWICLSRFRSHHADRGATVCTLQRVVNVRRRFRPPILDNYLGNCFVMLTEPLSLAALGLDFQEPKSEEDLAQQIAPIVCLLRSRLNAVDNHFVRDYLSQFSSANAWADTTIHEPDVAVTSIRRLRVYAEEFGPILGKVLDFEMLPYMNPNGVCTIKPRRSADQAWEVTVTLGKEDMELLKNDAMMCWLVEGRSLLQIFKHVL